MPIKGGRDWTMSGNGGGKRQRLEEDEGEEPDMVDVKLSQELQKLIGGRIYVKQGQLTRAVLLDWAKQQGAVKEINLISVTVQTMGGTEFESEVFSLIFFAARLSSCTYSKNGSSE